MMFRFCFILIAFFITSLYIERINFAQEEKEDEWQKQVDDYNARKTELNQKLTDLGIDIDALKASLADKENTGKTCEASIYSAVGTTKDGVADFRKKFEETEKRINDKTGTPADAHKMYFDDISKDKVRCLPEFVYRYASMNKKLLDWSGQYPNSDFVRKFDKAENIIKNKIGTLSEAHRMFDEISRDSKSYSPEFVDRYNLMEQELENWERDVNNKLHLNITLENDTANKKIQIKIQTDTAYIVYSFPNYWEVNDQKNIFVAITKVGLREISDYFKTAMDEGDSIKIIQIDTTINIDLGNKITVSLKATGDFNIDTFSTRTQSIPDKGFAPWQFFVIPIKKADSQTLYLYINNGTDHRYLIKCNVKGTIIYHIKNIYKFILAANTELKAISGFGLGTLIWFLITTLRKKRLRKIKPEFKIESSTDNELNFKNYGKKAIKFHFETGNIENIICENPVEEDYIDENASIKYTFTVDYTDIGSPKHFDFYLFYFDIDENKYSQSGKYFFPDKSNLDEPELIKKKKNYPSWFKGSST